MMQCSKAPSLTQRFQTPLILQQPIFSPDGGGGTQKQWEAVTKVWGQVIPQSAKEVEHDGHLVMKTQLDIYMRPQTFINATMRLVDGQSHYYITGYYRVSQQQPSQAVSQSQQILLCLCESFDIL